ncbi:MAG: FMN-binding protein [Bacillota bacterium]|nr:FMN-binding protein [Bacillota bacterium]
MRKKRLLLWIFGIVTILVIIGVIVVSQFTGNMTDVMTMQIDDVNLQSIDDGTYDGHFKALPIDVVVDVKIVDHEIVDIDILKHINGQGGAAETIVEDVINQQTLLVDTITGATYSSKVILKAISNALE